MILPSTIRLSFILSIFITVICYLYFTFINLLVFIITHFGELILFYLIGFLLLFIAYTLGTSFISLTTLLCIMCGKRDCMVILSSIIPPSHCSNIQSIVITPHSTCILFLAVFIFDPSSTLYLQILFFPQATIITHKSYCQYQLTYHPDTSFR